jgi:DNA mismatch repair protein MutL
MSKIALLDQNTIDKIAAGEVIERPASIVKELVENAIDAGANAITVEIKEGGISFVRITDNGIGIAKEQIQLAFLRHATSKLKELDDLQTINSLGFRGEALSSIAAVSQVELITKTHSGFTGTRYIIEGGIEKNIEDVGAPDGTTFLIRNLFYNTPARKKFLKAPGTEGNYVSNCMEQLALSHPQIAFKYMLNNQIKLHTSGNNNFKEVIYQIYGRDITNSLVEINYQDEVVKVKGYICKPNISRGNRSYENYYVNGRYVKSSLITKAIEDGYRSFMMKHKYPFTALAIEVSGDAVDVNVHPTKMEVRFDNTEVIYRSIYRLVCDALTAKELIPEIDFEKKATKEIPTPVAKPLIPEPFEVQRRAAYETLKSENKEPFKAVIKENTIYPKVDAVSKAVVPNEEFPIVVQQSLFEQKEFLNQDTIKQHRIIGQLFDTYWLVQNGDNLYIIDQHAAHEKVLYEKLIKALKEKSITSQYIIPAMVVSVTLEQASMLEEYQDLFGQMGFEITSYGGKEFSISAVPDNLFGINKEALFIEMLDDLSNEIKGQSLDIISEKIASMACKAAIKGNSGQSRAEIEHLIDELLLLDNPYHCPHGRPTIISMSKMEIEKKFKRIV